jgi:FkbM family methyltransferase
MNRFFRGKPLSVTPLEVEKNEYKFYIDYLKPAMTVFDVGANIGHVSLLCSKFVGKEGKIYAFEATPTTFQDLNTILEAAQIGHVKTFNKAVSQSSGRAYFHFYPKENASWNTLADRPLENYGIDIKPEKIEEIATVSLDDFCVDQKVPYIDLLKIDVEGAELAVLKGARKMLEAKNVGACLIEFGQTFYDMGIEPSELKIYLDEVGYNLKNLIKGQPTFYHDSNGIAQFAMLLATPK